MKDIVAVVFFAFVMAIAAPDARAEEAPSTPPTQAADPAAAAPPPSTEPTAASTTDAALASVPPSMTSGGLALPAPSADEAAAAAALEACNAKLGDDVDVARGCYRDVVALHPGTIAAAKADASIYVLERTTPSSSSSTLIPPGRLGVTAASGLFGVWNGVAAGWIVASNARVDGLLLVGGTGLASVALGGAMGAGGYFLADRLHLDEGAARLLASSLVWGTVVGVGMAPTIATAVEPAAGTGGAVTAAIGTVVGMGYVGAGAALLASSMLDFDEAEVSVMNSGGAAGMLIGLLIFPNLDAANIDGPLPYSATFVGSTVAGLGAGALVGRTFDLTWGESLLCDLGMVLGGVLGGTTSVLASPIVASMPQQGATAVVTSLPAVGLVGGYGAMLGFVTSWRGARGAPIWRDAPPVHTIAALVPVGRDVVPTWGLAGEL
jgi:hypothetical protein